MFRPFFVENQQGRRPFDAILDRQLVILGGNPERNEICIDELDDCRFWVRDRVHPFAAYSVGVEEIEKDQFRLFFCLFQPILK